ECVPIPSVSTIHFHSIQTLVANAASSNAAEKLLATLPIACQLDCVDSAFVTLTHTFNTAKLSDKQRQLLPLLSEIIFNSPMQRGAELVGHEAIVKQLNADLLDYSSSVGFSGSRFLCGEFGQLFVVRVKVEQVKFITGLNW